MRVPGSSAAAGLGWGGLLLAAVPCLRRLVHLCKAQHLACGGKGPHCAGKVSEPGDVGTGVLCPAPICTFRSFWPNQAEFLEFSLVIPSQGYKNYLQ